MKCGHWKSMLISGAATLCCVPAAQAGWVTVPNGPPALIPCNPKPFTTPTPSTCLLTGNTVLAALGAGVIPKGSASATIMANGSNVGTVYDRWYCYGTGTTCATSGTNANTYILATRVHLNAGQWNGHSAESFEVNDLIRKIKSGANADSAYWMGPPPPLGSTTSASPDTALANMKWVEYTGKTQYGLNDALMGQFDDNYIDHRNDANANDPDSVSSEWSAFVFVKQVCPTGVAATQQTFKIKLWEGGEELQDHYAQWMSGYVCN